MKNDPSNDFSLSDSSIFTVDAQWLPGPAESSDAAEAALVARCVQKLRKMPKVRMDRVREIKKQIEAGTYYSEEKWAIAVDALRRDMGL